MKIEAKTAMLVIYGNISYCISNLQDDLGKLPEDATRNYHDNAWDADDYGKFMSNCECIGVLLGLLTSLKIPKKIRDKEFEKTASIWEGI
jgi:hypothetical protein